MKARHILTLALAAIAATAGAQKTLDIEDRSQAADVYSSDGTDAAVIIRCEETIPLEFSSSMDKTAEPFRVETQGSEKVYYIAFPTGNRYRGRTLTVTSPGYNQYDIDLADMQPKRLYTFFLSDPNATVGKGCYLEHRNKALAEIKAMNYDEARLLLDESRSCNDADTAELRENMQLVDSLIYYRQEGEAAYKVLDYRKATDMFDKVMALNPYDSYASSRYTTCSSRYATECDAMFAKAEQFLDNKEYEKARDLYSELAGRQFSNAALAQQRLGQAQTALITKKDHARVLTYEYRKDAPIGFSTGKYYNRKGGGFFQMDFNKTVFDAARSDCRYGDDKFAELNMAFGWTIHIWGPLWAHFGPGVTGKLYYGTYLEDNYPMYKDHAIEDYDYSQATTDKEREKVEKDADSKCNLAFAISPVIGLTAKYSYFSLRVTYQYRFSMKSELKDFMGQQRISFGIGVAY